MTPGIGSQTIAQIKQRFAMACAALNALGWNEGEDGVWRKVEPTPDSDGWIPWSGGECPVDKKVSVDIRTRDHPSSVYPNSPASELNWAGGNRIIAYRIHKPEPAPEKPEIKVTTPVDIACPPGGPRDEPLPVPDGWLELSDEEKDGRWIEGAKFLTPVQHIWAHAPTLDTRIGAYASQRDRIIVPIEADPYAELKAAHAAGKVIQIIRAGTWTAIIDPIWTCPPDCYRIKPEDPPEEWVHLEATDVPVGSAFRRVEQAGSGVWFNPIAVLSSCVEFHDSSKVFQCSFYRGYPNSLFDGWQISRDGGKSWSACRKIKPAK